MISQIQCGCLNVLGLPCNAPADVIVILADKITSIPCCQTCASALDVAVSLVRPIGDG